jgi:putative transposase
MPRTARAAVGGIVYHILNRGNGRMGIFRKPADFQAFLTVLTQAREHANVDVFGFCLMPNHWHLVLRPRDDGDLARYLSWVTNTHVKRYRSHYPRTSGHLYQGRYKSFPVNTDDYFLTLLRYVEANPVRAKLAARAENWRWSSLSCVPEVAAPPLSPWPVTRPRNWSSMVNRPLASAMAERVALSLERGRPLGSDLWTAKTSVAMGLQYTVTPRGRPRSVER